MHRKCMDILGNYGFCQMHRTGRGNLLEERIRMGERKYSGLGQKKSMELKENLA